MPPIQLTDRTLKSLGTSRQQEDFWDRRLPGFGVRVTRQGRKSFVLMYRVNGSQKRRMTLGTYPSVGLADARDQARMVLGDVARGDDPGARKQAERKAETFAELADEYLERHAKRNKSSWQEDERKLRKDLLPVWGSRKATDIARRDVIGLLEGIVERGSPVAANRTLALVSRMFNFGIDEEILEHNPAQRVRPVCRERPRERVLTPTEIVKVWGALDREELVIASTFKARLLTAQRGKEVLSMRWKDIDGDWWTIPGEVSKNGLTHRVPLSEQMTKLLGEVRGVTGRSKWVFASPSKPEAHITAVRKAALRICELAGVQFTPHDLRRTAASHMTSMGISRLVVSKVLNHVERGVTAVYDRHSYDGEKQEALLRWGERVEELVTSQPSEAAE